MFARRRNRLTMHFSECITVVKRRMTVMVNEQFTVCYDGITSHYYITRNTRYKMNTFMTPIVEVKD
jgi:hypothetical protein